MRHLFNICIYILRFVQDSKLTAAVAVAATVKRASPDPFQAKVELEVVVAVVEAHGLPFLRSVPSTTAAAINRCRRRR